LLVAAVAAVAGRLLRLGLQNYLIICEAVAAVAAGQDLMVEVLALAGVLPLRLAQEQGLVIRGKQAHLQREAQGALRVPTLLRVNIMARHPVVLVAAEALREQPLRIHQLLRRHLAPA
jgi:hypothetical protein